MEALSGLVVYGPLGIWAVCATLAVVHLYREIGRLRDAHQAAVAEMTETHAAKLEALGKEHGAALTTAASAFAAQIQAIGVQHAQTVREQADRYDRQIAEMQQRTFTIVTTLSDKMSALADTLTRNRRP